MSRDEGDCRIRPLDTLVQSTDGIEYVIWRELRDGRRRLEFVGEDVDQQLRITVRVEVATVIFVQFAREFARVGEVPVVNEDDSVGCIDEERLGFLIVRRTAARRVSNVSKSHISGERPHVARAERFAYLTFCLRHVKGATLAGCDAGGVLTTVLKKCKRVINLLVDGGTRNDADDAAHSNGPLPEGAAHPHLNPLTGATVHGR